MRPACRLTYADEILTLLIVFGKIAMQSARDIPNFDRSDEHMDSDDSRSGLHERPKVQLEPLALAAKGFGLVGEGPESLRSQRAARRP